MKLGQLIEYNKIHIFYKFHAENEETNFSPLFVFEKALYEVKVSGLQLSFNAFR